jgi:hypothetical protein
MDFYFADDSKQTNPSRNGMGSLVAIGGIRVPGESVALLERQIDELCLRSGFPPKEAFKWSPGREMWMRDQLVEENRRDFFVELISLLAENNVGVVVVIADEGHGSATGAVTTEEDVTKMFIERVHYHLSSGGLIIIDRPGGDRADEERFLEQCLETLQTGTSYVLPTNIALSPLTTNSRNVRLLQAADVITGCSLARVGGEEIYSPPLFEGIKPLFRNNFNRIGGVGLKIHPDGRYANLYHWLLGDTHFVRGNTGSPMPLTDYPYSGDQHTL